MPSESNSQIPSIAENRELLEEIRFATEESPQSDLHRLTNLLAQVIDTVQGDSSQGPLDSDVVELINDGVREIRLVAESEQPTSIDLAALLQEATGRWGESLGMSCVADEDFAFDGPSLENSDAWSDGFEFASQDEELADEESEDESYQAPTAEEIASLLNAMGETSTPIDQSTITVAPASEPAVVDDTPSTELSVQISLESLDAELKEAFLEDASSCMASMEDALLRLENDPSDADSLNQIGRELHTLKGASASVGLSDLAGQLHLLEDRLADQSSAGDASFINALLQCVDSIRRQISSDDTPSEIVAPQPNPTQFQAATSQPAAIVSTPSFTPDVSNDDDSIRVKSSQVNRLMDTLSEMVMLRNRRKTEVSELQEVYHELIGSVSKMRLLSHDGNEQSDASSLQLSEVANDVFAVAQSVRDGLRPVAEGNAALSQLIGQLRQELVELRTTPISGLFRRLQRVVRDTANVESKQVRLQLVGEDSGIERSLQQRLYEPMLHIVRNAVCHGIESASQRERSGKEAVGTITVEAKAGPDVFVIEIRDDGGGLDYEAIRRRGISSGLLANDQSVSQSELSQLIFQPGFSTRESTNQAAGRGVGMDVVASTLKRMRGWLDVDSDPGKGTRIRLSFPIPSVIQHAMVFRSAGRLFALPMQSVQCVNPELGGATTLRFSEVFGETKDFAAQDEQRIVLTDTASRTDGHGRVTLLVDEVLGAEEVVVRPLPSLLRNHPYCNGATLSGTGELVLLLDARRVVDSQASRINQATAQPTASAQHQTNKQRPRVLVADDSVTARKRVVESLSRYPVEIIEASDGRQALEIFRHETIDAVFSDMEMPHVTGMDLLSAIKSDDRAARPPVVIISSRNEIEFTTRAKELGATDYLIKPLADESLDLALTKMPNLSHFLDSHLSDLPPCGAIQ
ncbi:hybrid sensor histidine kinase/response regulator [Planctomycetes bacterium K23_9]|uniref:Chemotaxis protein CheA n=1 Tax=Stieleria marina TaxID=1930275 RepID=A0A517NM01_9BACT|nr:Chemotaxis protein CheA [Planctomycetes bacterium K23_9]